jgi:hypothetical protein
MSNKNTINSQTLATTQTKPNPVALAKERSNIMKTIKTLTFAITLILLNMMALAITPTAHAQEPTSGYMELRGQILTERRAI